MKDKSCFFCGVQCDTKPVSIGAHDNDYMPRNGYDLCRKCAMAWDKDRLAYLKQPEPAHELFRVDNAQLEDIFDNYYGAVVFCDRGVVFLGQSRKKRVNLAGPLGAGVVLGGGIGAAAAGVVGGAIGGGLGALIAGAVANNLASQRSVEVQTIGDLQAAIDEVPGMVVVKRGDVKNIDYDARDGFFVETPCMKYTPIHVPEEDFRNAEPAIKQYLIGNDAKAEQDARQVSSEGAPSAPSDEPSA